MLVSDSGDIVRKTEVGGKKMSGALDDLIIDAQVSSVRVMSIEVIFSFSWDSA